MSNNESIIIKQLKKGDETAWKYIYDHHYTIMCRFAQFYLQDTFFAETIVGDTIFHLWETRETLSISLSLRKYLLRCVRNRCIDYLKSSQREKEIPFSKIENSESYKQNYLISDSYPLGLLLEQELDQEIIKAISKLPFESKQVFEKSRFDGKKYDEIAQELGISVNTVKYHIKQSLFFLKEELKKYLILFFFFAFQHFL